jgi:glycerol-3-phosphate acyltransferase PlsY
MNWLQMDWLQMIIAAVTGYLMGSLSMARYVVSIFSPGRDITKTKVNLEGSDKAWDFDFVSATTVSMHLGSKYGFITMFLDMLKIIIPVLCIKYIFAGKLYFLITAVTGMLGHILPLYYKFKGGRGILAVYGGLFAIDWIGVFATSIGGMLFGLIVLRDVLAAYVMGVFFIIPWLWFRTHNIYYLIYAIVVNIILAISVIPELKQMNKFKKMDKWDDPMAVFQLTGMGRGIIKMAKILGVIKSEKTNQEKTSSQPRDNKDL